MPCCGSARLVALDLATASRRLRGSRRSHNTRFRRVWSRFAALASMHFDAIRHDRFDAGCGNLARSLRRLRVIRGLRAFRDLRRSYNTRLRVGWLRPVTLASMALDAIWHARFGGYASFAGFGLFATYVAPTTPGFGSDGCDLSRSLRWRWTRSGTLASEATRHSRASGFSRLTSLPQHPASDGVLRFATLASMGIDAIWHGRFGGYVSFAGFGLFGPHGPPTTPGFGWVSAIGSFARMIEAAVLTTCPRASPTGTFPPAPRAVAGR
jgi:hypothetical protein